MEEFEVTVGDFTPKGYGTALLPSGKEVEIAHTVPGDQVKIEWRKKRRPPQKGRLLDVVKASEERVEPRCAHARVCGGCCWQQMDYAAQLKHKEERVKNAFGVVPSPILPSPALFGYRNKMEFSFSENRAGMRFLGLMIAQAEPYVFNVSECHLCPAWCTEALRQVRSWWESSGLKAYDVHNDTGSLRYLTLRHAFRTGQKMAILNVSGNPDFALTRPQIDGLGSAVCAALPGETPSLFLRVHQTKKGRPTQFYEMHLLGADHIVEELSVQGESLSFKISPASFFQPNTLSAELLYNTALSLIPPSSLVYDLYCGTGTLGMAAARKARHVVSIDLSSESILDAAENLKRNGLTNVTLHQGDVGKVLTTLNERPDTVIVDPPRAGLASLALHHLKRLLPKSLLYISCNPLTQSANIRELMAAGYRLQTLQPVDQFPHTYHIENIAYLNRVH